MEAEKAIEEENKSRPATSEGAIVTVEEEFEVRKRCPVVGGLFVDFESLPRRRRSRRPNDVLN